jgi:hypothetical protein
MFGEIPPTVFIRYVKGIEFNNVEVSGADMRPAFVLKDVSGADFFMLRVRWRVAPTLLVCRMSDFSAYQCKAPDTGSNAWNRRSFEGMFRIMWCSTSRGAASLRPA